MEYWRKERLKECWLCLPEERRRKKVGMGVEVQVEVAVLVSPVHEQ